MAKFKTDYEQIERSMPGATAEGMPEGKLKYLQDAVKKHATRRRFDCQSKKSKVILPDVSWISQEEQWPTNQNCDQVSECQPCGYVTDMHGMSWKVDQGVLDALGKGKAAGKAGKGGQRD